MEGVFGPGVPGFGEVLEGHGVDYSGGACGGDDRSLEVLEAGEHRLGDFD